MKLDELVEDVMNLDINKESMDDNRGHSHDWSTVCSYYFNINVGSQIIGQAHKSWIMSPTSPTQ